MSEASVAELRLPDRTNAERQRRYRRRHRRRRPTVTPAGVSTVTPVPITAAAPNTVRCRAGLGFGVLRCHRNDCDLCRCSNPSHGSACSGETHHGGVAGDAEAMVRLITAMLVLVLDPLAVLLTIAATAGSLLNLNERRE